MAEQYTGTQSPVAKRWCRAQRTAPTAASVTPKTPSFPADLREVPIEVLRRLEEDFCTYCEKLHMAATKDTANWAVYNKENKRAISDAVILAELLENYERSVVPTKDDAATPRDPSLVLLPTDCVSAANTAEKTPPSIRLMPMLLPTDCVAAASTAQHCYIGDYDEPVQSKSSPKLPAFASRAGYEGEDARGPMTPPMTPPPRSRDIRLNTPTHLDNIIEEAALGSLLNERTKVATIHRLALTLQQQRQRAIDVAHLAVVPLPGAMMRKPSLPMFMRQPFSIPAEALDKVKKAAPSESTSDNTCFDIAPTHALIACILGLSALDRSKAHR